MGGNLAMLRAATIFIQKMEFCLYQFLITVVKKFTNR